MKGKKDECGKTCVIKRLTGHEGVIFSITFNRQGTLLSTVSDDRSIRLWKVTNVQTFDLNGHVEPLTVVYGHTARVWDAKLLESCFVSIGEDLMCNVWDYEGNVIKVHKGHTGMTKIHSGYVLPSCYLVIQIVHILNIKSFLCRQQRIVGHKMSTNCLMARPQLFKQWIALSSG